MSECRVLTEYWEAPGAASWLLRGPGGQAVIWTREVTQVNVGLTATGTGLTSGKWIGIRPTNNKYSRHGTFQGWLLLEDYQIALMEMKVHIILTARSDHLMVLIPQLSKCSRSSFCVLMLIQILTEWSDCAHYNSYNHDNNWLLIGHYRIYIDIS